MTYTGLELFLENLKLLSYNNDDPLINNPEILRERPQIQRLYEELNFMIQIMFVEKQNDLNEIKQVNDLKTRFKEVAHEAHNMVGLFVYSINYRNTTGLTPLGRHDLINYKHSCSLNLENVMRTINSIREECIMILDSLNMDSSSPSIKPLKTQTSAAATSSARNPLGAKKVMEEPVLGIESDAELIRDKLVEDQKQLEVVSIVGMGGVGKTTLATKVFNDPYVVYHFQIRAWVTVSQTYEKKNLLIQILQSIGIKSDLISASHSDLRGTLHKSLMGKRYLIVVDDMWSIDAWDDLKLFFPNNYTGSRILLTSRLKEVALHAKLDGFVHELECLTDEESWELLCEMVFHGNDCPESLIKSGMLIAKNCHGLPLAVVVIAGVLAKEASLKDSWEKVAQKVSSYILNDENGHVDILGLSYEHLTPHLKDCFLYLCCFPEDHKFRVQKLIWLWIAEGFVQEDGNRSLEEIGEDYMMELVDRNLVVVVGRKSNGVIKDCSVHDLLRELCLETATKGKFCMKISKGMSSFHSVRQYKSRRIFTNKDFLVNNSFNLQARKWAHSLLCFHDDMSYITITDGYFHFYPHLTVLDIQNCRLSTFPSNIGLLVHLRYLAFWYYKGFPSSICNLRSLHTLIIRSKHFVYLPKVISNLVNLRHLWSDKQFYLPLLDKPMNLQTISRVVLHDEAESWEKYFPGIKKLKCTTSTEKNQDFKSLNFLETLRWFGKRVPQSDVRFRKIHVTFPASLKKLSLVGCCLPWSDMSVIQSLPNLEVLELIDSAFKGPRWETGKEQFGQLTFLKLQDLWFQQWEASSINFPCLKHLLLDGCMDLEEIPLEIGDIATLELIDCDESSNSVLESLVKIREEQQNFGNYDLKIKVLKGKRRLNFHWVMRGRKGWIYDI